MTGASQMFWQMPASKGRLLSVKRLDPSLVLLALLVVGLDAQAEESLAITAVAGNRASIEMLDPYYGEVRLEKKIEDSDGIEFSKHKNVWTNNYWRQGERIRIREMPGPTRLVDVEVDGSRLSTRTVRYEGDPGFGDHKSGS